MNRGGYGYRSQHQDSSELETEEKRGTLRGGRYALYIYMNPHQLSSVKRRIVPNGEKEIEID